MASKKINILLSLNDKFSSKLKGSTAEIRKQKSALNEATNALNNFGNKATAAFSKATKAAVATGAAIGALALKTGLSEALDLEGYRQQLVTATKDTEKASELMRYAIGLANKTPFEGGQMVESAAKFEAMAMDSTKWLTLAGDMAAATNKDLDQATEALIDAQTGELERLKEFGITKNMIIEQANAMGKSVVNNSGQITDLTGFNDALVQLMQDKYAGGMEAQANTVRGMWSTVTGITKNSLAKIVGMQDDGTVKTGSMLDKIKEKVSALSELLQKWQSDGTIDKISEKFAAGFEKVWSALEYLMSHGRTIVTVLGSVYVSLGALTGIIKGAELVGKIKKAITVVKTLTPALKLLKTAALGPVGIAIAAVAAALIYAYKNSDTFREICGNAFAFVKNVAKLLGQALSGVVDMFKKVWSFVKTYFKPLFDSLLEVTLKPILDTINALKTGWEWLTNQGLGFGEDNSGGTIATSSRNEANALGTPYFKGGLTSINERGGEIINLPSGTQIIPHDVSTQMAGGANVTVNLTVSGNVIGNRDFMEQMGGYISSRVITAMGVV